jgi:hypothetical protein
MVKWYHRRFIASYFQFNSGYRYCGIEQFGVLARLIT